MNNEHMTVQWVVKNFLPDYEKKRFRYYINSTQIDQPLEDVERCFIEHFFPEALSELLKAQRSECQHFLNTIWIASNPRCSVNSFKRMVRNNSTLRVPIPEPTNIKHMENNQKNNQLQLVTFEQAKQLKKAGFDWPTSYYYSDNGERRRWIRTFNHNSGHLISIPTVALALKWFRGVQDLDSGIEPVFDPYVGGMFYSIHIMLPSGNKKTEHAFWNYDEAEMALLDELLKLI